MEKHRLAGTVIRILRLQRNWSQETLCHGICAVSYLSKIEQGKVEVNENLLKGLLGRLGATWQALADKQLQAKGQRRRRAAGRKRA